MTIKSIIICIAIFLVLRILFRFLLPVISIFTSAKRTMDQIRQQQQQAYQAQNNYQSQQQQRGSSAQNASKDKKPNTSIEGEYIDYEEVK